MNNNFDLNGLSVIKKNFKKTLSKTYGAQQKIK